MSVITTPEKVKSLLSSFLAPSVKQSHSLGLCGDDTTKGRADTSNFLKSTPEKRLSSAKGSTNLRSFDSFLERLDTYSPITWFGKPLELSPLICSRYGWANIDTDSLQCVSCKAHLCGKLPDQSDTEAYNTFKTKLLANILNAHKKFCVLAVNPCPESFCVVECDDPTSLISGFTKRVFSLDSDSINLPDVDYSTLHTYNYDEGQGAAYCKRVLLPDCDTTPDTVALSLTGWSRLRSHTDILTCSKCRRQVGLWNFRQEQPVTPTSEQENGSVTSHIGSDVEPTAKLPKIETKSCFNPVEQHKHWCPWLSPTSLSCTSTTSSLNVMSSVGTKRRREEEKSSLPAFIAALKTIAPGLIDNNTGLAQTMKVSPMADGMRCFRRVMKAWSSPKTGSTASSPTKQS